MLFTTNRLKPDDSPLVLESKRESDGTMVVITIKLTNEVQPKNYPNLKVVQTFADDNKKCDGRTIWQGRGKNSKTAVTLVAHKVESWQISFGPAKSSGWLLTYNCWMFFDIKSFLTVHFIRTDTVYDLISEIHKREGGGVEDPTSTGMWVILILWTSSPQDTTTRRTGWTRSTGRRLPLTNMTGEMARRCSTRSNTPRSTTRSSGILISLWSSLFPRYLFVV